MNITAIAAKLTAVIELKDEKQLQVRYQLTNETREELCVLHRMYRNKPTGERELDADKAYVLFESAGVIHITRSLIAIPEGKKVEFPEVPYVTLLAPGKTLDDKIIVPIPVMECKPYVGPLDPADGKAHVFKQAYFSVGVMRKTPEFALRELPHVGNGIYAVNYGDAIKRQQLLKSSLTTLSVKGLVSKDSSMR